MIRPVLDGAAAIFELAGKEQSPGNLRPDSNPLIWAGEATKTGNFWRDRVKEMQDFKGV